MSRKAALKERAEMETGVPVSDDSGGGERRDDRGPRGDRGDRGGDRGLTGAGDAAAAVDVAGAANAAEVTVDRQNPSRAISPQCSAAPKFESEDYEPSR